MLHMYSCNTLSVTH